MKEIFIIPLIILSFDSKHRRKKQLKNIENEKILSVKRITVAKYVDICRTIFFNLCRKNATNIFLITQMEYLLLSEETHATNIMTNPRC